MTLPLLGLDDRVFFAVYAANGGAFTGLARVMSALGSGWIMLALVPLFFLPRWRRSAWSLTATLLASTTIVFTLKFLVGRLRPCACLPGVRALCAMPVDPSFPSGHACGSFTFAAFVIAAMYRGGSLREAPRTRASVAVGLLVFAVAVAWSRVYLGVRFPSDVTVGALLGLFTGTLAGARYGRVVPDPA